MSSSSMFRRSRKAPGESQPAGVSRRLVDRFMDGTLLFTGVWLIALGLIVCYSAIVRKAGSPAVWPNEMSTNMLLWGIFLGAGATYLQGGHVNVDTVLARMPGALQRVTGVLIDLSVIVFALVFTWAGWVDTRHAYDVNVRSREITWLPAWPVKLAILVGSALLVFAAVVSLVRRIRGEAAAEGDVAAAM